MSPPIYAIGEKKPENIQGFKVIRTHDLRICLLLSAVQNNLIYSFIYFLPGKDWAHKNDLAPKLCVAS